MWRRRRAARLGGSVPEQREQCDFFSHRLQDPRDLVSRHTAHAFAADEVRPVRLDRADFRHVISHHLGQRVVWCGDAVRSARLQPVKRLIGTDMARQHAVNEELQFRPPPAGDEEERTLVWIALLDGEQTLELPGGWWGCGLGGDVFRDAGDGGRAE